MRRSSAWRILAFAVVALLPFAYLIALSLVAHGTTGRGPSLASWRLTLAGSMPLMPTIMRSIFISTAVAIVSTAAAFTGSRAIARHRLRHRLLAVAYVPFIFSPVILGTTLMYLFLKADLAGTVVGVIVSQVIFAFGFGIIFFDGFWTPRVRAIEEEARSLGCSTLKLYAWVLMPVFRTALLLCVAQTFLISWFQYGLTLLIGSARIRTLPLLVYEFIQEANPSLAAIASLFLIVPPVFVLLIGRRISFRTVG